jgi:hypothetical protein
MNIYSKEENGNHYLLELSKESNTLEWVQINLNNNNIKTTHNGITILRQ